MHKWHTLQSKQEKAEKEVGANVTGMSAFALEERLSTEEQRGREGDSFCRDKKCALVPHFMHVYYVQKVTGKVCKIISRMSTQLCSKFSKMEPCPALFTTRLCLSLLTHSQRVRLCSSPPLITSHKWALPVCRARPCLQKLLQRHCVNYCLT